MDGEGKRMLTLGRGAGTEENTQTGEKGLLPRPSEGAAKRAERLKPGHGFHCNCFVQNRHWLVHR